MDQNRGTSLLSTVLVFLTLFVSTSVQAQRGALVYPRNLAELTAQSSLIVRGSIVSAHAELMPGLSNLWTVVVTLDVQEVLKGRADSSFTFRQFIWDPRDRLDVAGYHKGDRVMLLLNPPTRYGLTSPVGLEQGRFRVFKNKTGQEFAVNGFGNAGLFNHVASQLSRQGVVLSQHAAALVAKPSSGPIRLDDLRDLIQSMVGKSGAGKL
jgi:hypothetical protein